MIIKKREIYIISKEREKERIPVKLLRALNVLAIFIPIILIFE